MITSGPNDAIVVHTVQVTGGQRAQVATTERGNVAFVYGDDELAEATVLIRARCPLSADVLDVSTCACAATSRRALSVARRAPLGVFVYLESSSITDYADVMVFLAHLAKLQRLFLPEAAPGDVALLRDATGLEVVHRPTLRPPNDPTWPTPRADPGPSLPARFWQLTAKLRRGRGFA